MFLLGIKIIKSFSTRSFFIILCFCPKVLVFQVPTRLLHFKIFLGFSVLLYHSCNSIFL
ncbi:hypothetical protein GIB67_026414 [Kingdonia uniflora]|uniref:Uncharacterized protein n=1 Tax=Kingdonia uniflora TaxID=39325 RepID=A0A7J7P654_9MAGN|nr:hypothetical protein GIB67_026414 [Kingdonia uniflora]